MTEMCSCKFYSNRTELRSTIAAAILSSLFLSLLPVTINWQQTPELLDDDGKHMTKIEAHTPAYLTTRRDAIITYVRALQAPEGYFHAYLEAPPPFALDGTMAGYSEALDAYNTLRYIDRAAFVNWTQTKEFLSTLVDDETGLLNLTGDNGPNVGTCFDAVTFYIDIGLGNIIDFDAIADYVAGFQHSNGGFYLESSSSSSTLIGTYFALNTLNLVGKLYLIDIQKSKNFVMSCIDEGGGYSNIPNSSTNIFVTPAGIMLTDILELSNEDMRNRTTTYLLQNWNDEKGADIEEDLYITERIAWSFCLLGRKDFIDNGKMFSWLLDLQKHWNGAFVGYPEADIEQERLVNAKYVTHILSMYEGISLLDEDFSVVEEPIWEIPQWWIDYINSEWSTTTTHNGNPGYFEFPDFSIILEYLPSILLLGVLCTPAILVIAWVKNERIKRRQLKKERKNRRKGKTTW